MLNRLRALLARWHELNELDHLTDRDLDDLGLTRQQVTEFARLPADVPARMAGIARIFGLTPEDIARDNAAYVELAETCGSCGARRQCARTLAAAPGQITPADVGFCANARSYAFLAGTAA
jgi:hypothetical protein